MSRSYDIPRPLSAIEGEHGTWTVQAYTPSGPQEWVLIECSPSQDRAERFAGLLNDILDWQDDPHGTQVPGAISDGDEGLSITVRNADEVDR